MRYHAELENQSKHTLKYLQLFVIHEFAQFYHEVFKVHQINVVFKQLEVTKKDQWAQKVSVWYHCNHVRKKIALEVVQEYDFGLHLEITLKEVQENISSLYEADEYVVALVINEIIL